MGQVLAVTPQRAILRRVQINPDRDECLRSVQGMIKTLAKQWTSKYVPLEDLLQAGQVGALEAYNRFDPSRGVQFQTFAWHWIRREIRMAAISLLNAAKLTDTARTALREEANRKLDDGSEPTELARLAKAAGSRVSLDEPRFEGGVPRVDLLEQGYFEPQDRVSERANLDEQTRLVLGCLPIREGEILIRTHVKRERLRVVAADIGVSKTRILQVRDDATINFARNFRRLKDPKEKAAEIRGRQEEDFVLTNFPDELHEHLSPYYRHRLKSGLDGRRSTAVVQFDPEAEAAKQRYNYQLDFVRSVGLAAIASPGQLDEAVKIDRELLPQQTLEYFSRGVDRALAKVSGQRTLTVFDVAYALGVQPQHVAGLLKHNPAIKELFQAKVAESRNSLNAGLTRLSEKQVRQFIEKYPADKIYKVARDKLGATGLEFYFAGDRLRVFGFGDCDRVMSERVLEKDRVVVKFYRVEGVERGALIKEAVFIRAVRMGKKKTWQLLHRPEVIFCDPSLSHQHSYVETRQLKTFMLRPDANSFSIGIKKVGYRGRVRIAIDVRKAVGGELTFNGYSGYEEVEGKIVVRGDDQFAYFWPVRSSNRMEGDPIIPAGHLVARKVNGKWERVTSRSKG